MADPQKDLDRWLRQQFSRTREKRLERFILRSAPVGSKGQEVEVFPIPDEVSVDTVGIFVDEILSKAQADADAIGNKPVRYTLIACEEGRKDGPRTAFRLRGEAEDEETEGGEEPATPGGVLAQMMRHNEAMMRMVVVTTGAANQMLARRLEQAEATNIKLFEQRNSYLEAAEAAKSLQHERDMQMLLTSGQEERKGEMMKKLEMMLPLIVNKVTGRDVLPSGNDADVFGTLANSLSQDQLAKIAPYLTGEQQMLLMTLIKAAREKQSAPNGVAS